MKYLKFLALLSLFLLAACAPKAVPAPEATFYKGTKLELYAAAIEAISTSPGLDNSSGWIIRQSDSSGGFVSAQTTVETFGLFGIKTGDRTETLSIVISEAGADRTQLVIQRSEGAQELAERVRQQLDAKFNRA
ncbi:MAG: hypothetical protein ACRCYY_07100 [Trueperaceae bacterium]